MNQLLLEIIILVYVSLKNSIKILIWSLVKFPKNPRLVLNQNTLKINKKNCTLGHYKNSLKNPRMDVDKFIKKKSQFKFSKIKTF